MSANGDTVEVILEKTDSDSRVVAQVFNRVFEWLIPEPDIQFLNWVFSYNI
ncbi:hypothetical protein JQC72_08405 [Polycladomyces sp. WAk]|uniref:Uncharacterized protein n=1 Tax=Polycladomyces zharkentensis TaxID=2807616 RepID=A0ABS2WJ09_9BACL|nr:hypothetical protein [Polycladomyces sp. WAk]MBN2909547.1 hypothetical protein [Polycladomyces sp. WAk]